MDMSTPNESHALPPVSITFDAIERVKREADQQAAQAALAIRRANPFNPLLGPVNATLSTVQPNFRFYRRLRGLRSGDLQRE